MQKIFYTQTDEAPGFATVSLLPIIQAFLKPANIEVEVKDISLAARILASFPEHLQKDQIISDDLKFLSSVVQQTDANIMKLPNISASVSQLNAAISELQEKGYKIPDYCADPKNKAEEQVKELYSKVLGSAVNPVLREGNSDRRVAKAVKKYAEQNPHSMGEWSKDSKTHIASMQEGDFFANEKSYISPLAQKVQIIFKDKNNQQTILKDNLALEKNEILDSTLMSVRALRTFFAKEIKSAKQEGVLLSAHLKATMMKISDPIIFGHLVEIFFADIFDKYKQELTQVETNPRTGWQDVLNKIKNLPEATEKKIKADIEKVLKEQPSLAMVNSDKGITNLHVPSDVIIDASLPAMIRNSGKMYNNQGQLEDTKALVPDRCYADVYTATINFCKKHGAFDVKTMGDVSNVGLMAKKAEEYGSHDKTFEIKSDGVVEIIAADGSVIMSHKVESGDIWRACQTKDIAIIDWVKLAVNRAKLTGNPAVFWLNKARAHDNNLITQVNKYLAQNDTDGLDIQILAPLEAAEYTLNRVKNGQNTISVTGNVLRDYLTDLFPILELGSSSKMLSIVPLLLGGSLLETGAGGTAPKLMEQLINENHLRWDSLGEFLAMAASLETMGQKTNDAKIKTLAQCLDQANEMVLNNKKSPKSNVKELDNRGSQFYYALYWAKALAEQTDNSDLSKTFTKVYQELAASEEKIIADLTKIQGKPCDLGGYYFLNHEVASKVMRPSSTFNNILAAI